MHQYTAHTYHTISNSPELIALWRDFIPTLAFRHRFLLLELLAFAAHHKLHQDTDDAESLVEVANTYHQQALTTYIALLDDITEENCQPLFAFSQIIVGVSLYRLTPEFRGQEGPAPCILDSLIGTFRLLKGAFTVAKQANVWLWDSELEPMMHNNTQETPLGGEPGLYATYERHLTVLGRQIEAQIAGDMLKDDRREVLLSAIHLLRDVPLDTDSSVNAMNKIIGYPVFLDTGFVDLLTRRDEAALVVLAHYCVALHELRHVWFVAGMGDAVLEAVTPLIGDGWSHHLRWPRTMIKNCYAVRNDAAARGVQ